ncbi:hypothetical protein [Embleya sp. NPDC020886]|uniref:hypothetical protein n=1 Tax=Embleya sp. NPDC020886 TaxID=3363980 RepID=UPI0037A75AF6
MLRNIDADPLVDRTFTWPGDSSAVPLRQVLHSLGSCGLFTREGRPLRVSLTSEAKHVLDDAGTTYLIAVLHAHVRFFGEILESIGEGLTCGDLNRIASDTYGLGWKTLVQVRRRLYWMHAAGMVESWTNG